MSDFEIHVKDLRWCVGNVSVTLDLLNVVVWEELFPFLFRGQLFDYFFQKESVPNLCFFCLCVSRHRRKFTVWPTPHTPHPAATSATQAEYMLPPSHLYTQSDVFCIWFSFEFLMAICMSMFPLSFTRSFRFVTPACVRWQLTKNLPLCWIGEEGQLQHLLPCSTLVLWEAKPWTTHWAPPDRKLGDVGLFCDDEFARDWCCLGCQKSLETALSDLSICVECSEWWIYLF